MTAPIAAGCFISLNESEPIADRMDELTNLLKALALATEQRLMQQGALNFAARNLADTAERLCTILDRQQ